MAILFIIFSVQIYFFISVRGMLPLQNMNVSKYVLAVIYVLYVVLFVVTFVFRKISWSSIISNILFIILLIQVISCVFFLIDNLRYGIVWIEKKISSRSIPFTDNANFKVSRNTFIKWVGIGVGLFVGGIVINGFSNKYNYQKRRIRLKFKNLPIAFEGLKIIQISDIHSGSLKDIHAVEKGVQKILNEKPDMIVFTGDLVNNKAEEFLPLKEIFKKLKAPLGVYSILGNHDYGDYTIWDSQTEKDENLHRLKQHHYDINWHLLLNQNVVIKKGADSFALIGVENWGNKMRFTKYGDLKRAIKGVEHMPFKILLSHDPSHWDAEVRRKYKTIDLTLSGHTHGMQFGVDIKGFRWSPIQYIYKQWAGLYVKKEQRLYVNRGFGFIGYQGRVGILPEITVFHLSTC